MESITIVMMETSNTFEDCMKMRIGTLLSIIKNIHLRNLMQNKDWRDAYLKYQYKKAYENNKVVKQTKIDLQKLLELQNKL